MADQNDVAAEAGNNSPDEDSDLNSDSSSQSQPSSPDNDRRPSRRLIEGVGRTHYPQYPRHTEDLPANTTFRDICRRYPNHLWDPIIQEFDSAGFSMEEVWRNLPHDARHDTQDGRQWNYLQQRLIRSKRAAARRAALPQGALPQGALPQGALPQDMLLFHRGLLFHMLLFHRILFQGLLFHMLLFETVVLLGAEHKE